MAIHTHRKIRVAYVFWPVPLLTPRWFDDNDWALMQSHPRIARPAFALWARLRSCGLIRVRYAGRA